MVKILRLKFPCEVKQVSPTEVNVEMAVMGATILCHDAMQYIAPDLSAEEQDKLADDITLYAIAEGFKRSIRIS